MTQVRSLPGGSIRGAINHLLAAYQHDQRSLVREETRALGSNVDKIVKKVDRLGEEYQALDVKVNKLTEAVERLQDTIEGLRSDIISIREATRRSKSPLFEPQDEEWNLKKRKALGSDLSALAPLPKRRAMPSSPKAAALTPVSSPRKSSNASTTNDRRSSTVNTSPPGRRGSVVCMSSTGRRGSAVNTSSLSRRGSEGGQISPRTKPEAEEPLPRKGKTSKERVPSERVPTEKAPTGKATTGKIPSENIPGEKMPPPTSIKRTPICVTPSAPPPHHRKSVSSALLPNTHPFMEDSLKGQSLPHSPERTRKDSALANISQPVSEDNDQSLAHRTASSSTEQRRTLSSTRADPAPLVAAPNTTTKKISVAEYSKRYRKPANCEMPG